MVQTDNFKVFAGTQTDKREDRGEMQVQFVSRLNYNIASQEERAQNEEPATMKKTQLEASHHKISEGMVSGHRQQ